MTSLGSISELTAVYGVPAQYDTFINQNGVIISEGEQSLDICVSNNTDRHCLATD